MKFSHSLLFNCVPEWSESYLSYGALKKALYAIERAIAEESSSSSASKKHGASTNHSVLSNEAAFLQLFESELARVHDFYRAQEKWCVEEMSKVRAAAVTSPSHHHQDLEAQSLESASDGSLAQKIKKLYVTLNDLKDYFELNRSGFTRIVQKYERYVPKGAVKDLLVKVDKIMKPNESESLDPLIHESETIYGLRVTGTAIEQARAELAGLLRERVSFERATVWQQMVEFQRKEAGVEPVEKPVAVAVPGAAGCQKGHHPKQPLWLRMVKLGACLAVFSLIWFKGSFSPDHGHIRLCDSDKKTFVLLDIDKSEYARRAGAVCILAIMFWCLEVIPLFATAVLVPFLATVCNVFPPDYLAHHGYIKESVLSPTRGQAGIEASISRESVAKAVFSSMFSASVMLLIGGFSIASALSKHGIAKRMATFVLGKAGRSPGTVLLVVMAITTIASTFISNVAAPVLVFTLIQPVLRALGVDEPLAKSLVLGVAYAANIGGFMSPISSPQNILTKLTLEDRVLPTPSTGGWMIASLVCAPLCLLATFQTLRFFYPSTKPIPDVLTVKPNPEPMTRKQWMTTIVSILGIVALVATDSQVIKDNVGTLGVMAIAPLVAYFGLNLLGKEDFNGFMWNVVMIAMGGSAVGSIAKESGLLESIGSLIQGYIAGLDFIVILCIFSLAMLIIATFVSHSVSSAVLAPLLATLMQKLYQSDPNKASVMVMVTCFVCSVGMGMPISGFPNMTAMSIDDALGRTFIDGGDFARTGLLASALCTIIILIAGNAIFSFQFSS